MEIDTIKSELKMENLYFSKCLIERAPVITDGKLGMNLAKNIKKVEEHSYDVALQLEITKEDLNLVVIANARFVFEAEDYSGERSIVEHNTVAIMFPYVRSQVTLMTSQPGMQPIIVPPINTSKL